MYCEVLKRRVATKELLRKVKVLLEIALKSGWKKITF